MAGNHDTQFINLCEIDSASEQVEITNITAPKTHRRISKSKLSLRKRRKHTPSSIIIDPDPSSAEIATVSIHPSSTVLDIDQ